VYSFRSLAATIFTTTNITTTTTTTTTTDTTTLRCQLTADDVQLLADSPHANTLQMLRLDYNDLNTLIDPVLTLLGRLNAIQTLRMQACRIKYRNCLRCAETLAHSRTLRTWNFVDNVMYKVSVSECVRRSTYT